MLPLYALPSSPAHLPSHVDYMSTPGAQLGALLDSLDVKHDPLPPDEEMEEQEFEGSQVSYGVTLENRNY